MAVRKIKSGGERRRIMPRKTGDLVNPSEFENELVVNHRYTEE